MPTIKPTQISTHNLASLSGSQSSPSPSVCPHQKTGSAQTESNQVSGQNQMLKVVELLIGLLTKVLGGCNDTIQLPGGTSETKDTEGNQSKKTSSFLDKLGEMVLGFFTGGLGKLFG